MGVGWRMGEGRGKGWVGRGDGLGEDGGVGRDGEEGGKGWAERGRDRERVERRWEEEGGRRWRGWSGERGGGTEYGEWRRNSKEKSPSRFRPLKTAVRQARPQESLLTLGAHTKARRIYVDEEHDLQVSE